MEHNDEVRAELRQPALDLRAMIPEVLKGYSAMSHAAMADGELSTGFKDLLALGAATPRHPTGGVGPPARGAARAGVTRQQVAEAVGVSIMMNGGPGTVWGPRALRSFDEAVEARRAD